MRRFNVLLVVALLLCAGRAWAGQSVHCSDINAAPLPGEQAISCEVCPISGTTVTCIVTVAVFNLMRLNNACLGGFASGFITGPQGSIRVNQVLSPTGVSNDQIVLPHPMTLPPGGCAIAQFPGFISECGEGVSVGIDCNQGAQD